MTEAAHVKLRHSLHRLTVAPNAGEQVGLSDTLCPTIRGLCWQQPVMLSSQGLAEIALVSDLLLLL